MGTSPWVPPTAPERGRQGPAGRAPQDGQTCQLETSALLKGANLQVEDPQLLRQSMAGQLCRAGSVQGHVCYAVQWHCAISFFSFMGLKFSATAHYSCCHATGNRLLSFLLCRC